MLTILDILAVGFSITGTFIFSWSGDKIRYRLLTNIMYIVSNTIMIYTFSVRGLTPYILLQSVFFVCSIIGIYKNRAAISLFIRQRSLGVHDE